ncbi:MAG TPA: hypothetical protein VFU40_02190 [Gemmatimonadales bacterium]|nr:hypothetical protein [Gemmatimonadales bacterium]
MAYVARAGLAMLVASAIGCGGGESSQAGQAAAAARDSVAKADSIRAIETAKTLKVTSVMIGKRIGEGDRVTEPTFQFAPADTVYLSIATMGSPDTAALAARWTNQRGEVVDSSKTTIKPKGRDNTALRAARAKGWAPGAYRVTVYADGDSVDSRTFAVQKPQ